MANRRQSPRDAPRHTGESWERGHELRREQEFAVSYGPFESIQLRGFAGKPNRNQCVSGTNALIQRGAVYPLGEKVTETLTGHYFSWMPQTFWLDGLETLVIPGLDSGGSIIFTWIKSDTTTGTYDTGISSSITAPFDMVAWGNDIYFVYGTGSVVKYDPSAGSHSTVSGSPSAGEFIFVTDNNLCVAYQSSNVWTVAWSIDGDPTDFSSVGSGSAPAPRDLGELNAVSNYNNIVALQFSHGAWVMSSTGGLPAFRFAVDTLLPACGVKHGAVVVGQALYCYTASRLPCVFRGGVTTILDGDIFQASYANTITHVRGLDCVVFQGADLYDIHTDACVGNLNALLTSVYLVDHPVRGSLGSRRIKFVSHGFSLVTGNQTSGYFKLFGPDSDVTSTTPSVFLDRISFPRTVELVGVLVKWVETGASTSTLPFTINVNYYRHQTTTNSVLTLTDPVMFEPSVRMAYFKCNAMGAGFSFGVSSKDSTYWYNFIGLVELTAYFLVPAEDELVVLGDRI